MKYSIIIFLSLIIQSCTTVESYSEIVTGNTLIVKKSLVIPADQARVTIQYGKVASVTEIELYHPRCWFISRVIKNEAQVINAGEFRIAKVRETYESVQRTTGFPFAGLSFSSSSSPTADEYFTEMDIVSNTQSNINRLICSHWEDPYDAKYLTLKQINIALGELAEIVTR